MHAYPSCSIIIMHIYMHACGSYIASYTVLLLLTQYVIASYIVTVSDLIKFDEPLHNSTATSCLFCMVLPRVLYHS